MKKIVIFDLDDTLFDSTRQQLNDSWDNFDFITLFPGVIHLLDVLKSNNIMLALITTGNDKMQNKKILTLKIASYFDTIVVCEQPEEKLTAFEQILKANLSIDTKDIFIVGDRIDREIMYGNMLGCTTIRVCGGGKWDVLVPKNELQYPLFSIQHINDSSSIIL